MTKIEWVRNSDGTPGVTWNPIVGCSHVSAGCDGCYAARQASGRLRHLPIYAGLAEDGVFTGEVRCVPERLEQPDRWVKPRAVFVNSMSDLFHAKIPMGFLEDVWDAMVRNPRHTFQVLTKRPQRIGPALGPAGIGFYSTPGPVPCPQPNIWLGTSIESDSWWFRKRHLTASPAAVRFLSLEPLLGPLPSLELSGVDWVIVGGESGPRARPIHPDWVRPIRDACVAAEVPFLFKQWGEWAPDASAPTHAFHESGILVERGSDRIVGDGWAGMTRKGKRAAGRMLDGELWDEIPVRVTA